MAKTKSALAREAIDQLAHYDDPFDTPENEAGDTLRENDFFNDELLSHAKIKSSLVGNISELKKSYAKVILETTTDMAVDDFGLVHSGFIFGSAEYAAVASINQENVVVIACRSKFFAPAKVGNTIEFEAKGRFEDARKREVKVIGKINDIKVFEGIFQAVLLENHILKTKMDELQANLEANAL